LPLLSERKVSHLPKGENEPRPQAVIPARKRTVTIDEYSQIFSRPNTKPVGFDGNLQVHLHGSQAGSGANGLRIEADGVTVRGLIIDGFDGSGIVIRGSGNRIEGNFIGTSRFGRSAPTGNGVDLDGGELNTIGGITPAARNIISGNAGDGVNMFGTSLGPKRTLIMGNYIGTDKFGTGDLGNGLRRRGHVRLHRQRRRRTGGERDRLQQGRRGGGKRLSQLLARHG
jgi:hypothetical protein